MRRWSVFLARQRTSAYSWAAGQCPNEWFSMQWIERRRFIEWPASFPDLKSLNLFLYGFLKNKIVERTQMTNSAWMQTTYSLPCCKVYAMRCGIEIDLLNGGIHTAKYRSCAFSVINLRRISNSDLTIVWKSMENILLI